ncbi:PEP-CTERM sorting domain-containing protein [Methylomarinum sp. Ch1-1]|uniref:PEP-CTERM sorting domain-containing protein n=1 Tax=Methylomarinum roseum TaxID=3067653 RepID=A0AAU7NYW4_9GAMM|nr:PEP-CTERM sorting domain-containing protein [Methylomarinum sp. Ch1-1]MDP4521713.1 PEP-CTERM sorting domain-containing protein [Methylomarinum sp. Ch1-1]
MNTKTFIHLGAIILSTLLLSGSAQSAFISASNSCPGGTGCDTNISGSYGFEFIIEQDSNDLTIFYASLTNTSDPTADPEALIDEFGMNIDATLGLDFTVYDFAPSSWSLYVPTGGGIQFDYVGSDTTTGSPDRLGAEDVLTFTFDFVSIDSFTVWTGTDTSTGGGLGGGEDSGQLAVSFQQLGQNGQGSDLLAANWSEFPGNPEDPPTIPEPASLWLMGLGLLGFYGASRKKAD